MKRSAGSLSVLVVLFACLSVCGNTLWYDGEQGSMPITLLMNPGEYATEVDTDPHGGSTCLSLDMNASDGWAHVGLTRRNWATVDLTSATSLEFWARSASGAVMDIQMELHGASGGCAWIWIRDYVSGDIGSAWQKVTIPASAFSIDKSAIHTVDFWLGSGTASLFIDDMEWTSPGSTNAVARLPRALPRARSGVSRCYGLDGRQIRGVGERGISAGVSVVKDGTGLRILPPQ